MPFLLLVSTPLSVQGQGVLASKGNLEQQTAKVYEVCLSKELLDSLKD